MPRSPKTEAALPIGAYCDRCVRSYPFSEMIELAASDVCVDCKPLIVQMLREGSQYEMEKDLLLLRRTERALREIGLIDMAIGGGLIAVTIAAFVEISKRFGASNLNFEISAGVPVFCFIPASVGSLFLHSAWTLYNLNRRLRFSVNLTTSILFVGMVPSGVLATTAVGIFGAVVLLKLRTNDVKRVLTDEYREFARQNSHMPWRQRLFHLIAAQFPRLLMFVLSALWLVGWMRIFRQGAIVCELIVAYGIVLICASGSNFFCRSRPIRFQSACSQMIMRRLYLIAALLVAASSRTLAIDGMAYFESKVRPILVSRCYDCHSEAVEKQKGGLWLDRRAGWQQGGDSGPALVPGQPDQSLVIESIRYLNEDLQMPPKAKLPASELKILERWVAMGAPDPRDAEFAGAVRKQEIDFEAARKSWAFRQHTQPKVPSVEQGDWAAGPIDRFILAGLEKENQGPAQDASPNALIRRLHFDLTGLPPTAEEVAAFVKDPSIEAYRRVVDDLLSRQTFGEKWGRHWLDVARYSDSNGGDRNFTYHQAWRYRNYVIESFNDDRSYYEFVRQQLAGDLLPAKDDRQRREQIVASGYLALGPKMLTERDKEKLRLDVADEQVDTIGRSLLGLTMGCARCHDHKFDPVSQEDYYAMTGIFRSTQVVLGTRNGCVNVASWVVRPLPVEESKRAELQNKIERMELAMRLTVDNQFKKAAGGKMANLDLPLGGIIYDEADAELTGAWRKSTLNDNRFGKGYVVYDQNTGPSKAVFRASLPKNGEYEVRVAYSSGNTRVENVPITIEAWHEIKHLELDQRKKPEIAGLFQPVGRFRFEKGGRANVIISSEGTEGQFIILDAIQFIPVADIEHEANALASAKKQDDKAPKSLFELSSGEVKKVLTSLIGELKKADVAIAPREAVDAGDIHLRVRGEVGQLGKMVARNFPQALHAGSAPEISAGQSGRLEFAEWITNHDNALLDRVIVNRVWHHLFGRGIVASVDNFGALGAKPTHPGLLDWLATRFRQNDGSIKGIIRQLVLSHAYRLASQAPAALEKADPENELFGRQNRRRLTAEEIRDSVIFLAGRLDTKPGTNTSLKYGTDLDKPMSFAKDTLRTVYLPIARNNPVAELALFDVANPDLVSGNRAATTVPTQALYLMNNDFFLNQARKIAQSVASEKDEDSRIRQLYQKVLNRPAGYLDIKRAKEFLNVFSADTRPEEALGHFAHLLLVSTEFLFLD